MTVAKAQIGEMTVQALVKRARHAAPLEVCGFIMNSADPDTEQFIFDVPNIAPDPTHWWKMDVGYQALAMTNEDDVFGVWHSHPRGPDGPSHTDMKYVLPLIRFFVVTFNGVFEYGMEHQ